MKRNALVVYSEHSGEVTAILLNRAREAKTPRESNTYLALAKKRAREAWHYAQRVEESPLI